MNAARWARPAAATLAALCLVVLGVEVARDVTAGVDAETVANSFAGIAFAIVGGIVALRRPEHVIGWLLVAAALLWTTSGVLASWSDELTAAGSRDHGLIAVLGTLAFAGVGAPLVFVLLVFPTGRLVSGRWRWLAHLAGLVLASAALSTLLTPTVSAGLESSLELDNPLAAFTGASAIKGVVDLIVPLSLGLVVGVVAHLAVRVRRSSGVERLQMRWLVFVVAAALTVLPILGQVLTAAFGSEVGEYYGSLAFGLALASIPVGIGAAVLRYRLFEIDRIISRTVSYLLLTGVLVGVYALGVLGVGALLPGEPNDVLVAGSTLVAAALVRPLRSRIQAAVDRRFNRSRYDAVQAVEALGRRLRDRVDLDDVTTELRRSATAALTPRHVGIWLTSADVTRSP